MNTKKNTARNQKQNQVVDSKEDQIMIAEQLSLSSDSEILNQHQRGHEENKSEDSYERDDTGQPETHGKIDHLLKDTDQTDLDPNVSKIVTILFMSHRIQAKVYNSDTLQSFLDRLRVILTTIDKQQSIGLYHLYFLKQEEDGEHGTLRNMCTEKAKKDKKDRSHNQSQCNSVVSVTDMIPTPLQPNHIINHLQLLQDNENYLVVYTNQINFPSQITWGKPPQDDTQNAQKNSASCKKKGGTVGQKKTQAKIEKSEQKQEVPYHETLLPGKTYFKVLRGTTTANRMLFCSYSECIQQFSDTGDLKTHMRTHTNDRPFSCSFEGCGKSFITKGHLQTHILIHTGEKPYSCEICGKSYARSGRLKIHKRTHTGEKPFKCQVCGTCFTENGNLKTHMRIHTGEKPFRCEFKGCGKSFTTQGHLIDHKRKHTNTRPFECDICQQTFMRQSTLKLHMKRHQGAPKALEKFICNNCKLQFSQQEELDRHIHMHHSSQGQAKLQKQQSELSLQRSSKSKHQTSVTKTNTSPQVKQAGSK